MSVVFLFAEKGIRHSEWDQGQSKMGEGASVSRAGEYTSAHFNCVKAARMEIIYQGLRGAGHSLAIAVSSSSFNPAVLQTDLLYFLFAPTSLWTSGSRSFFYLGPKLTVSLSSVLFPGSPAEGRLGLVGLSGSWRGTVLAASALLWADFPWRHTGGGQSDDTLSCGRPWTCSLRLVGKQNVPCGKKVARVTELAGSLELACSMDSLWDQFLDEWRGNFPKSALILPQSQWKGALAHGRRIRLILSRFLGD